jgi:choline dehydrogenase-like flavoprotein
MTAQREPVDVLVIGAGASGAAFTWSLSHAGIKVLCLEQGGWVDPSSYAPSRDAWELHRYGEMHPDPNIRRLPADYPLNNEATPIVPLMYNAVGGSTIHWSGHFPRFKPSDFRVKTLDGVAVDWPLSYTELEPYFDLNDRMMGVSGLQGDPAYPPKPPRPTPPIPLGRPGATIAAGFDKLGWHWWPSDSAIITRDYDGRRACNNCGPCDLGCAVGAKASTDITYWPKALALGAQLETNARVREITVTPEGLADGAIYYDRAGRVVEQKARAVVVACNGIGTPRLLLNSRSARFPNGLANSSGQVGRNLMFHPYALVQGVFDERMEGYKGPNPCMIWSQEFYETDPARGFARGYSFQVARSGDPVGTALGGGPDGRIPWGAGHRAAFDARYDRSVRVVVIGEDLPEEHNRVELDAALADSDGIPSPKVSYTLSENSRRLMDHGIARAQEVLEAAGAHETLTTPLLHYGGFHLMGTARMGTDPATSVVNAEGRAHDVPNLFVIDGSVLPTCGGVNPTSTIQAVALWIADRFIKTAKHARQP